MSEQSWWSSGSAGPPLGGPPTDSGLAPRALVWNRARLERNRILLMLSGGGIGLVLVLLATTGPSSAGELVVEIAACLAFFVVLLTGLVGFERSARVQPESRRSDVVLARLDTLMLTAFLAGVALCILVALSAGLAFLQSAGEQPDAGNRFETSAKPLRPASVG